MSAFVDLGIELPARPGALADFGDVLGEAGVSLEGGGVFTHGGVGVAHFLVADGDRAASALSRAGLGRATVSPVVMLRLDQETPGQLGRFTRRVADAGIDVLVQYSDHDGRLILVVPSERHDDCAAIARQWDTERTARPH
ncbi:hypothetical protein [Microbacterium immunditiarum]|uniref:ACT domain-containing protein n=1 Tax=Microbacterium immunditiarum TaxID=337480 RepID=A0A7Y9KJX8_9MICO|nr:hypothetical protein [Microbacterium immunditiarum]NYE20121.1 hypothetical protein [Microbacterium immunditiarum]